MSWNCCPHARNGARWAPSSSPTRCTPPKTLRNHHHLHHCKQQVEKPRRRLLAAASTADDASKRQQLESSLTASLTTIGLAGSVAVAGAALCHISLFSLFDWNRPPDLALALGLHLPLLAAEAALFGLQHPTPPELLLQQGAGAVQQEQQQQLLDMGAVTAACSGSSAGSGASWQLLLALYPVLLQRCQSDLKLFSPPQVLGLLLARDTSRVLLQQGFMLSALAGWLTDRLYEAGLDDVITLSNGGIALTLPQLGLGLAALVVTASWAPAAFVAAEEAQAAVCGAMLLRTDAGQALAAQAAAKRSGGSKLGGGSGGGGGGAAGGERGQQSTRQGETGQPQQEDDEDEEPLDPLVLEYRLGKVTKQCFSSGPVRIAYNVTLGKELGRVMLPSVAAAATSCNLAAVLTASLAVSGLLVVWAGRAPPQALPLVVQVLSSSGGGSDGERDT